MHSIANRPLAAPAQHGFAIIEALIALLIFSLATLGLVGLQASLTRATAAAKYRTEAAYLASDLIGTIWVDAANIAQYKGTACASHPLCSRWSDKVAATLPSGTPEISVCLPSDTGTDCTDSLNAQTINRVTITIWWSVPGDEERHRYSTATNITPNT